MFLFLQCTGNPFLSEAKTRKASPFSRLLPVRHEDTDALHSRSHTKRTRPCTAPATPRPDFDVPTHFTPKTAAELYKDSPRPGSRCVCVCVFVLVCLFVWLLVCVCPPGSQPHTGWAGLRA